MKYILGIDPGFSFTGFSCIKSDKGKLQLIDCGLLKLPTSKSLAYRTHLFYDFFKEQVNEKSITHVALETSFLGKNSQSFLKLGYLRGILYLLSSQHDAELQEFSPSQVKQAVTGFGGAQKEQVARVIHQLFPQLPPQPKLDVTDAIAIALCGAWRSDKI